MQSRYKVVNVQSKRKYTVIKIFSIFLWSFYVVGSATCLYFIPPYNSTNLFTRFDIYFFSAVMVLCIVWGLWNIIQNFRETYEQSLEKDYKARLSEIKRHEKEIEELKKTL